VSPSPAGPARSVQHRSLRYLLWALSGAGVLVVTALAVPFLFPSAGGGAAGRGPISPVPREASPGPATVAGTSLPVLAAPAPGPSAAAAVTQAKVATPSPTPTVPAAAMVGEVRKFEGHADSVSVVTFSPDGRRALSGSTDGTVRLWDVATGRELTKLQEPVGNIVGVAFSPDGRRAIAGCYDRTLRLWDLDTGKELKKLQGHTEPANRVVFSPDGRHAASASWDRTVRLWDLDAGTELRRFEGHAAVVFGLAFSPDGRHLISGSWDRTARLWDVATGKELKKFEGHTAEVGDVAYSTDGRRVLTGSNDGTLRLWDVESGHEVARLDTHANTGWAVALSSDGRRALTSHDHDVALWDIPTGKEVQLFKGHSDQVTGVSFAPDGHSALSSGRDRLVRLWGLPPVASGPLAATPTPPAPAPASPTLTAPRDSSQSALLAKAAEARQRLDAEQDGNKRAEFQLAFNAALRGAEPALTEVAVGTAEQPARFMRVMLNSQRVGFDGFRFKAPASGPRRDMKWEFIMPAADNERGRAMKSWYIMALTGDMIGFRSYTLGKDEPIEGVDFPTKFHVVQGLGGGEIRPGVEYLIWFSFEAGAPTVPTYVKIDLVAPDADVQARIRATNAALRRTFELPDSACGLGVSPDGRRALMAAGASVFTGDIESGQVQKRWDGPAGNVRGVAFSPDGKLAAVGCGDGKILLVDVDAGKELRRFEGHTAGLRCVAFLPDGKLLVSGAEDQTARLWDVATGKEVRKFAGHTDQVLCLAVSPDGRRFATGPSVGDKVARVWDVATGKLVARLEGNAEAVYALAFSPDGKAVLTGGEDMTLRLYDATTGRPIRRFKPDGGAKIHALAFLPDGRVVVGSDGNFVTFWSGRTGRLLSVYEGPLGGFPLVTLAPGGRLLTGCGDRTVRVWTLPPFDAAAAAMPTKADLVYLKSVVDGLEATTPEELGDLKRLDLNDKADDAGLAHLARLTNLETLSIAAAPRVRGAGLAHLAPLTWLESLNLGDMRITSAGVVHLKLLTNLKMLDLQNDAVTGVALQTLVDLPNLETLNLAGTKIDDDCLSRIRGFKKLSKLTLRPRHQGHRACRGTTP
jgi:WD40 repeat protein